MDTIIYAYTRRQALEDGELVDVSELAREVGYRYPAALTRTVYESYVRVPPGVECQDETGRLWDILWMCSYGIRKSPDASDTVYFDLIVRNERQQTVTLKAVCGPDDEGGPCVTIMLPEED